MAEQPARKNQSLRPTDDFVSAYANHTFLEPSFWDLKVIFGQLDQSVEPMEVEQHTAITISWPQAKILSHFLNLQIAGHELINGKISLNKSVLPPEPEKPSEDALKQEPRAQQIYELVKKMHDELVKNA